MSYRYLAGTRRSAGSAMWIASMQGDCAPCMFIDIAAVSNGTLLPCACMYYSCKHSSHKLHRIRQDTVL